MKLNLDNLITLLLPSHKRLSNRMNFLKKLLSPLKTLYNSFVLYRQEVKFFAGITAQTLAFETYLNTKLDAEKKRIKILHFTKNNLFLYNNNESATKKYLRNNSESYQPLYTYLSGEGVVLVTHDYKCSYPNTIADTSITAEILKFNIAGKRFQLVSFVVSPYSQNEEINNN